MYLNPKHIIIAMGIIIVIMMMYIIHLLKHTAVNSQQPIIIIPGNGSQLQGNNSIIQDRRPANNFSSCLNGSQSDFFKKSLNFSVDYLMNRSGMIDVNSLPLDSQQILSSISMLNDSVKQNIITAINYFSIDAANASNIENKFRTISSDSKMPLWMVILREGASKVIPSFNLINDNNFNPNFISSSNLTLIKSGA